MDRPQDKYTNVALLTTTQSAANTLTSSEIVTGISLGQRMGILIDHIDYFFDTGAVALMTAAGDWIQAALSTQNDQYTSSSAQVIDQVTVQRADFGTAASGSLIQFPLERYFSPPYIIATPRLFLNIQSTGLANAVTVVCRVYFRYISLTVNEYLEIAESFILTG